MDLGISNQTLESDNSGALKSQSEMESGSQLPFPTSQQHIDGDEQDEVATDIESNQKKLNHGLASSKVPQRRATINVAKPFVSMTSTTFMDPTSMLPTRRGSRAVPFDATPTPAQDRSQNQFSSEDIDKLVTNSPKYKDTVDQNEKLKLELVAKGEDINQLKTELRKLNEQIEKFKIMETIEAVKEDQIVNGAIASASHAQSPVSKETAWIEQYRPDDYQPTNRDLKSNFYHKLRLLVQVGNSSRGSQSTAMQSQEIRWIIQMAHDKNEENIRLRTRIAEIKREREQVERSYQQEIDVLQSQLQSVGDRCVREKIMAERWFTRAELHRLQVEKLTWMQKEATNYRQKREETRVQSSHLVNGIRALNVDKKQRPHTTNVYGGSNISGGNSSGSSSNNNSSNSKPSPLPTNPKTSPISLVVTGPGSAGKRTNTSQRSESPVSQKSQSTTASLRNTLYKLNIV